MSNLMLLSSKTFNTDCLFCSVSAFFLITAVNQTVCVCQSRKSDANNLPWCVPIQLHVLYKSSVFLSLCLSVFLSFCLSVFISFYLFIFFSFYLFVFLSFCLSVFLFSLRCAYSVACIIQMIKHYKLKYLWIEMQ